MTNILILMAAFVAAMVWAGFQQRRLVTTTKRLERVDKRLHSTKLTLSVTKAANEELMAETMFLKNILYDVAKGKAHVWIEDDELKATRKPTRSTPIH